MTPRCVALLPLLAVIGVARTAAEEPESQPSPTPSLLAGAYSLIATDGRYHAVDESLNAVTLVREEEGTSKLAVRWSALGAGKDRFYCRAGDLLLTALTNDEYRRRNKEQTEEEGMGIFHWVIWLLDKLEEHDKPEEFKPHLTQTEWTP